MKRVLWRYLVIISRLVIGIMLIYAAVGKIKNPFNFSLLISGYEIVDLGVSKLTAIALPWIELTTGIFLVLGWWLRAASFIATGLFLIFIIVIGLALIRGLEIECGCFGLLGEGQISFRLLLRDVISGLMAILIFVDSGKAQFYNQRL